MTNYIPRSVSLVCATPNLPLLAATKYFAGISEIMHVDVSGRMRIGYLNVNPRSKYFRAIIQSQKTIAMDIGNKTLQLFSI